MDLKKMAELIHKNAVEKGWWGEDGKQDRNIGELIALIHSEVSEALEDWRIQHMLTHFNDHGKPCGFPSELADVVIRVLDLCQYLDIDLEHEIYIKMAYNKNRSFRHGNKVA